MTPGIRRLLVAAATVGVATVESVSLSPLPTAGAQPQVSRIDLTPCHIDLLAEQVLCGVHEVFADRERRSGARVPIHVAVLPALRRRIEPDPLFLMAGGPGQGARGLAPVAARYFREIRRHRDIVLVDLRGTGASGPLQCGAAGNEVAFLKEEDAAALARQCLQEIDGDPRLYTHQESLADLNEIRAALGYDRINLWGGSWGTRAALLFALRYPEVTRTVILDGAVALTHGISANGIRRCPGRPRSLDRSMPGRRPLPDRVSRSARGRSPASFSASAATGSRSRSVTRERTRRNPSRSPAAWPPTSFAAPFTRRETPRPCCI